MQQIKTKITRAFVWLKAKKIRMALAAIIVLVLIGGVCYALVRVSDEPKEQPTSQQQQEQLKTPVRVESEPTGIAIKGTPECAGETTPYDCTLTENETVLLAPSEVVVQNKTYQFKAWVGCQNASEQPGACLVQQSGQSQLLRVIYEEKTVATAKPQPRPQPAATPSPNKPPQSTPGICGGTQARIENNKVICEFSVAESILPVEVRLLAPYGFPEIELECSASDACQRDNVYFTAKKYTEGFYMYVDKPSTVTIRIPVTRQKSKDKWDIANKSSKGTYTYTSSYWVYGSAHNHRCCGTNPPLIYDIYNGYTEAFTPNN